LAIRRTSIQCGIVFALVTSSAVAGRPSITDDAGVVGGRAAQLETWLRLDRTTFEHWVTGGYGVFDPLELSAGIVHGTPMEDPRYALLGPFVGVKWLAIEPVTEGHPGLAIAASLVPSWGYGGFEGSGWSAGGYAAFTESPLADDVLLLHVNLGVARVDLADGPTAPIWGGAAMVRVVGPLSAMAEVVSGDPATTEMDGELHGGVKLELSDTVHLDATLGAGIWGSVLVPPFATLGFRLATE
jgi:hypothetical protein